MSRLLSDSCRTRVRLYEEHEKLALKRIAQHDGRFKVMKPSDLEKINERIALVQRQLREHEQTHHCH